MQQDYNKVIEVGSSSGALASAYRTNNQHCEYIGVELTEEYAIASQKHCTRVVTGNIESLSIEDFSLLNDADCWVFADVLEHLYDPWHLLEKIKSSTASRVEIIASIPNLQNWAVQRCINSGQFVYMDSGLLDRTHIRWFTRLTILDMFSSAGYSVKNMLYRNMHTPEPGVIAAIRNMAVAANSDPDNAERDAIPFQYILRAVSND
jgi:hypothetical protein